MDAHGIDDVVRAVQERISEDEGDAARFEVGPLSAGEEDGVVYVPIRYRETIDASRRYELYVRLGAIEADVRAKTGRALALLPGLPPSGGEDHLRRAAA